MPDEQLPTCSLVIVAFNAAHHLAPCLNSLAALDYPSDRYEVIVVDNGSTDETLELLGESYSWVRVLPQGRNLGFAEANDVGAEASGFDCVAPVNADMHFPRDWLREMVRHYDPEGGVPCVSSLILDWDGSHVDFAGGLLNWAGHGNQVGYGRPVGTVHLEDGRELLFPCGGAMLIERELFLDVGGFDPSYFIYFEDVDLGWRLRLFGHRTVLAATARAYHRGHGTTSEFRTFQVKTLYERNALRTLIKNLGSPAIDRVLPGALLLLAKRAADAARHEGEVPRLSLAHLHAAGDLVAELDVLLERRRQVQARRVVADDEILPLFRRPFQPSPRDDDPYLKALVQVVHGLRLDRVFDRRPATRVVVVGYDRVGQRMAGPAVRSWEIAAAWAQSVPVVFASEWKVEREPPSGVSVEWFASPAELERLVEEADVVLVHGHAVERFPFLRRVRALRVVDLYDPWLLENLENQRSFPPLEGDWIVRRDVDVQRELLDIGDFFVCASERQRDYWLGMLSARGRLDGAAAESDPTFRSLIDVVPYGCPDERPQAAPVLKGVHPQVPDDAFLLLWGGGTWDWFDPLTVLDAFTRAHEHLPNARLYFMGLELPDRGVPAQRVAHELRTRATELGVAGDSVLFGDWVPYDERGAYLAGADVGVLATRPLAEVRLAFRSRLLDHFWAGLPTIMTGGDTLADLVEREQAGIVCAPGDTGALTSAILALAQDPQLRNAMAANAAGLADRFRWRAAVRPLRRITEEPWRWTETRRNRPDPTSLAGADPRNMVST